MAQIFNTAVLTKAGVTLLARSQVGTFPLTFTRVAMGDGIHEDKTESALKECTALISEKQSFPLSSKSVYSETQAKVTTVINNVDLNESYYMNEIGLYAREGSDSGTEILFGIAVANKDNADLFPAYNGKTPVEIIQSFVITVSNTADVQIVMGSDAYALASDFYHHIDDRVLHITGDERAHWNEEEECSTTFREDGSIVETTVAGAKVTEFLEDGSIVETYPSGACYRTVFNADGSIEKRRYEPPEPTTDDLDPSENLDPEENPDPSEGGEGNEENEGGE